jgi:hypothetical protein
MSTTQHAARWSRRRFLTATGAAALPCAGASRAITVSWLALLLRARGVVLLALAAAAVAAVPASSVTPGSDQRVAPIELCTTADRSPSSPGRTCPSI